MNVFSELKNASLESLETDPVHNAQQAGRVWRNHTDDKIKYMASSEAKVIASVPTDKKAAKVKLTDGENSHIGEIRSAMLTEAQFQAQTHIGWVLADGRSVSGSGYESLTGNVNIPDLRSVYLRGKDNGRGINPDGDLTTGSYQADTLKSHSHSINTTTSTTGGSTVLATATPTTNPSAASIASGSSGGNETRPKSVTVNYFIRIN